MAFVAYDQIGARIDKPFLELFLLPFIDSIRFARQITEHVIAKNENAAVIVPFIDFVCSFEILLISANVR